MNMLASGKTRGLFLALIAVATLAAGPAAAHRFNVTLVIPQSGGAAEQGRQFRQGFMLATTERDAHANEESDGHLGGLDSYVRVIDAGGDLSAQLGQGQADIVAVLGAGDTLSRIGKIVAATDAVLLAPGQLPAARSGFNRAYEKQYGSAPTSQAARGYNAAQRIDRAVRAQGGVGDSAALRQSFEQTARDFTW